MVLVSRSPTEVRPSTIAQPREKADGTERGHGPRVPRPVLAIARGSATVVGIRITNTLIIERRERFSGASDAGNTARLFFAVGAIGASGDVDQWCW